MASSQEKRDAARAAGADHTLDYGDLKSTIREATGGGAHIVVDPVGGAAAEAALRALAAGGHYCVVGFASGEIPRLPANIVLLRNRSVVGVDWGDWSRTDHVAALGLVSDVLSMVVILDVHDLCPVQRAISTAVHEGPRHRTGTA